jgi:hypothetical protein
MWCSGTEGVTALEGAIGLAELDRDREEGLGCCSCWLDSGLKTGRNISLSLFVLGGDRIEEEEGDRLEEEEEEMELLLTIIVLTRA